MLDSLILEIRDFLHDPDGDRWTDARLLYYINKAQQDLVNKTKCLSSSYTAGVFALEPFVILPDNILALEEVYYKGVLLPIVSNNTLSTECDTSWIKDVGIPSKIVATTDRSKFRLYPLPIENSILEFNMASDFGFVPDLTNLPFNTPNYPLGVITRIRKIDTVLDIHYRHKARVISDISDVLDIDEAYEMAIKYYVCGNLLRSDKDSNSRSLGNEELGLYREELNQLKKETGLGFTLASDLTIPYRRL